MDRETTQQLLGTLGEPKEYKWDDMPPPGGIDPGPMPLIDIELDLDEATFSTLSSQPHSRLYRFARQEGLDTKPGDTKAVIVKTILVAYQGENP